MVEIAKVKHVCLENQSQPYTTAFLTRQCRKPKKRNTKLSQMLIYEQTKTNYSRKDAVDEESPFKVKS